MFDDRYRSEITTPCYLANPELERQVRTLCGPEGTIMLQDAVLAYMQGDRSFGQIVRDLGITDKCILLAFWQYCDSIDREDKKWAQRGNKHSAGQKMAEVGTGAKTEESQSQAAQDEKNGFWPPQTAEERQVFVNEVAVFATENHLDGFDAEAFVQLLELKSWKTTRGTVLVCWKQAARKCYQQRRCQKIDIASQTAEMAGTLTEGPEAMIPTGTRAVEEVNTVQETPVPAAEHTSVQQVSRDSAVSKAEVAAGAGAVVVTSMKCSNKPPVPHANLDLRTRTVMGSDIPSLNYCIQKMGGQMTPQDFRLLLDCTAGLPSEVIVQAADLAAEKAVYNPVSYLRTTLQNWKKQGQMIVPGGSKHESAPSYPQRSIDPSAAEERGRRAIQELRERYGSDLQ